MRNLIIEPTAKTPKVILNADINVFEISGRSIPEDSIGFYRKILDWIDEYAHSPNPRTNFKFELEYFNTSSSKCLLDLFRKLEKMYKAGHDVEITWCYDADDEDMEETGEDYKALLDAPFNLVSV
jgi:SiaC family regulatory phosphoprotein